jgi:hypothetical protein
VRFRWASFDSRYRGQIPIDGDVVGATVGCVRRREPQLGPSRRSHLGRSRVPLDFEVTSRGWGGGS